MPSRLFGTIRCSWASAVLWSGSSSSCHNRSRLLEATEWITKDATRKAARRTILPGPVDIAVTYSSASEREQFCLPWIWMGDARSPRKLMRLKAIGVKSVLIGMVEVATSPTASGFPGSLPSIHEAAPGLVSVSPGRIGAPTGSVTKPMPTSVAAVAWPSVDTESSARNKPVSSACSEIRTGSTPWCDCLRMICFGAKTLQTAVHLELSGSLQ